MRHGDASRDQHGVSPSVELHIEELVLNGFKSPDRRRIAGAIQSELTRLLGQAEARQVLAGRGSIDSLNAGSIRAPANARPEVIGAQVAQAVFRGITSSRSVVPSTKKTK